MTIISDCLIHDITLWAQAGYNGEGNPIFKRGVKFRGRWQPSNEMFTDTAGKQIRSTAVIFAEIEMEVGNRVLMGVYSGMEPPRDSREIQFQKSNISLSGDETIYKAFL